MTDSSSTDPATGDVRPDTPIVVTGGSGFIGTNLMAHLIGLGFTSVVNLDIAPPADPAHRSHWTQVDLCDGSATTKAIGRLRPRMVVHLAARADLGGATLDDYRVNTDGVANVIDAVRAAGGVERVLFASSQLVCTPGHRPVDEFDVSPPNPYGESKVIGEQLVREHMADGPTWLLLRPTSIWGPWWSDLYSAFFRSVRAGLYVHPRGVDVRKSFGYVGNTVHQYHQLLSVDASRIAGRTMYQSDYESYPMREWAEEISRLFGRRPVREVPAWVLRVLAAGGDGLQRIGVHHPPMSSYRLRNMTTTTEFDMEPLQQVCGPLPYTRADGNRLTWEWMVGQPTRHERP